MAFVPAMRDEQLWIGEMRAFVLGGRRVLLLRLDDRSLRAYENRCVHQGLPLSDGTLNGHVLTCRAHHYQYDASTGRGINPACTALVALPVRVTAGEIMVEVAAETRVGVDDAALDGAAGCRDE